YIFCSIVKSAFIFSSLILIHPFKSYFFKIILSKIETCLYVIIFYRESKYLSVFIESEFVQISVGKNIINDVAAKSGIIKKRTIPVPYNMFVIKFHTI